MVSRIAQELNYVALIFYFQWHYWTRMSQKKRVCKKWKGLWSKMASIGSFQNRVWRTQEYWILAFCFLIHVFYHGYHGFRDFFYILWWFFSMKFKIPVCESTYVSFPFIETEWIPLCVKKIKLSLAVSLKINTRWEVPCHFELSMVYRCLRPRMLPFVSKGKTCGLL